MSEPVQAINTERLCIQRFLPASPDRVFRAWTDPDEMPKWWGPEGVRCLSVEVDLRVAGRYRIANELPDKSVLWISGIFEVIERPHRLIYTWTVENKSPETERVEVNFKQYDLGTEITITHERIASKELSEQHRQGWEGCLDGLANHLRA